MSVANGSADPSTPPAGIAPAIPHIVGINFGNAFSSISILSGKDKGFQPECIANEDGERQIACSVSFHGEQVYIGNEALNQLVKNPRNTITGFRNLLGKRLDEITTPPAGAPLIPDPNEPSTPAYTLTVLAPSPAPLPTSAKTSAAPSAATTTQNTPSATPLTADPTPVQITHTPKSITTLFLRSLLQSATDFLGFAPSGYVITCPPHFNSVQKDALRAAAEEAGRNVNTGEVQTKLLQIIDEVAAVVSLTTSDAWATAEALEKDREADGKLGEDRNQLIIDVGASSTSVHLVSLRSGLAHILSSKTRTDLGGDSIDALLVSHFAKEFAKKAGQPFPDAPKPTDNVDENKQAQLAHRAHTKLLLAIPHLKRTLAASSTPATLSVESLHGGIDFTSPLTRLRFDILAKPVYQTIADLISEVLKESSNTTSQGLDPYFVDEIIYTGSTASLPGLDAHLLSACNFQEDVVSPFAANTVVGGGIGDPSTLLSRGCAVQAGVISSLDEDGPEGDLRKTLIAEAGVEASITSKDLGLLFPSEGDEDQQGGTFVTLVPAETPLPVRRIVSIHLPSTEAKERVAFEVWEATTGIRIEKVKPPKVVYSDDEEGAQDEEEEEEEEEVKHRSITRETLLGAAELEASPKNGVATLELKMVVRIDGGIEVAVKQIETGVEAKVDVTAV
ncbi:dnak-type molecular chaperone bipa [Moniliophthora roreri MCA 2997]|uniref:Dnak-type molecular chaperone bipa n=2 Tax=Moniliophthora roreri TaxID=221103 RepID=V2Y3Y0_MONRO|nr:dnak-type molecular chaperone bipa [Moniliophthora roreri MCA 2997]KAI3613967.1 dnak-type molecular chaperone bipa [Moniliophthora roreri]